MQYDKVKAGVTLADYLTEAYLLQARILNFYVTSDNIKYLRRQMSAKFRWLVR